MSLVRVHNFSISLDGFGSGEPQSHDAPFGHAGERRARIVAESGSAEVSAGSVVYVPAHEQHRFVDVTEDLVVLVVFAPPEGSRGEPPDA